MKILKTGTRLFRGGTPRPGNAFYALSPNVAKMYGSVSSYKTKRPLKLFVITHDSLKRVFKYLSKNVQLLMRFSFGTDLRKKNQEITLKRLFGNRRRFSSSTHALGQRLSITEIDTIALRAFAKEFLTKRGYDGVFMPSKKTSFHKGLFHSEIFISKFGLLHEESRGKERRRRGQSLIASAPITELFIKYTKGTQRLLKAHPSQFVIYLSGGMAVKLYLRARGIRTAKTSDFDFKFAVPRSIKTQREIDILSESMRRIMFSHVSGFVRFLNRNGIHARLEFKEVQGVPLDKPSNDGDSTTTTKKKVYKVYNYTIVTPNGRRHELVDTSLVLVPGISRKNISLKWSRYFGIPIQTLTRLWRDTLYILAGSFVVDSIKLRNPIDGAKKEKGIKNAIRVGHMSYLKARKQKNARLVNLSRKLIENVMVRDKKLGTFHSEQILKQLQKNQTRYLRDRSTSTKKKDPR